MHKATMGYHISVAVELVCPTKLVPGEIVDAALCVKSSTVGGLAITDVGERAKTVKAYEMALGPGLGKDVILQEAQDVDATVALLDEIGAQVQTVVVHHYKLILLFAAETQQTLPHHDCLLVCSPNLAETRVVSR